MAHTTTQIISFHPLHRTIYQDKNVCIIGRKLQGVNTQQCTAVHCWFNHDIVKRVSGVLKSTKTVDFCMSFNKSTKQ